MVFNQNHASILRFISSIIIIVGLPTGFYLMFRMLDVIVRTPSAKQERGTSVGVRGITGDGLPSKVIDHIKYASTEIGEGFMVGLQNGLNETLLNGLAKQITHTVIINAMIYPHPPLLR